MFCVRSVSFSVLLNGSTILTFKTQRGIQQGYPLSPYLFILCSEILSRLIQKAEDNGDINSIKIARNAPGISHLMFADDIFLFCRKNMPEVGAFMSCRSAYEAWSGQKVSSNKSSLFFSPNASKDIKRDIGLIAGMSRMRDDEKYLGNPLFFSKSKVADFQFIKKKLVDRLES